MKATFAAGCFWGVEAAFRKVSGVTEVISGYTGGSRENPTYEEVCAGETGHAEAVEVEYDRGKVGYDRLLRVFEELASPVVEKAQYRSEVFYHDEDQKKIAEKFLRGKFPISPAGPFYRAEEYHQDYYRKHNF
jgi:methionine-S-sulfoxide reductase